MSENLTDGNNVFSLVGGVSRQRARTVARRFGDPEHQHDDPTDPMLVHAATTHVSELRLPKPEPRENLVRCAGETLLGL
jgi:hypothetical protein